MNGINCWLQSSLSRVFPGSEKKDCSNLSIVAARGERISLQACVKNQSVNQIKVGVSATTSSELNVRMRRVGYVPVAHHSLDTEPSDLEGAGHIPGFVPDPLFDETEATIGPFESHVFWVTVFVPADIGPGMREIQLQFRSGDSVIGDLQAQIDVKPFVLQPRRNFPVTHWFYADAICDWYGLRPYEERFWSVVEPYMRNLVEHGNNSQYVPIFTPPTDGVKKPHQLLKVSTPSEGRYTFDFSDVRRWVRLADSCGAEFFEWTHLFTQ